MSADAGSAHDAAGTAAVARWLEELRTIRRYSSHTLAAYRRDLQHLLDARAGQTLASVSSHDLRQLLAQLHRAGAHPRSLSRMLSSWRGFYLWWSRHIALPVNPADGIRAPKTPRGLPKALSVEQASALFDAPAATALATGPEDGVAAAVAARDRAMFELLYSSGLRLAELTGLDVRYQRQQHNAAAGWLDREAAEVMVRGKGGKQRSVPVGRQALAALDAWLHARPRLAADGETALFVGVRGARISPRVVQRQLAQWAQQAGVPSHVHPHVLRHSFASHILQSAQDLRAVQEMLGHASISTTQIYTRLDFQHLAAVYDRAHPRALRQTDNAPAADSSTAATTQPEPTTPKPR